MLFMQTKDFQLLFTLHVQSYWEITGRLGSKAAITNANIIVAYNIEVYYKIKGFPKVY